MLDQSYINSIIKSKFVRDSAWLLGSYSILAVLGIFINILIVEYFGAEKFGTFSLSLKIYLIASLLGSMGSGVSIVKYTAEFKEKNSSFKTCLTSALFISFTAGMIVMITIRFSTEFFESTFNIEYLSDMLKIMALSIPLFCLNKTFMGALNGMRLIRPMSILLSLRWIVLAGLILFFSLNGKFENLAWSFLISEAVLAFFCSFYFRKDITISGKDFKEWTFKHLFFGSKSISSNIIMDIYYYLDVFMVAIFLNAQAVGIYSFASDIAKNLLIPANILQTSFNPLVSKFSSEKRFDELRVTAIKLRNHTFIIYIPIVLLSIVIYPLAISLLENEIMIDSTIFYVILSLGILFISGYKPLFSITEMAGFPKDRFLINLSTLFINGLLNIVLFHFWGMIGVASATVLSYFFSVFALNISSRKRLSFNLLW